MITGRCACASSSSASLERVLRRHRSPRRAPDPSDPAASASPARDRLHVVGEDQVRDADVDDARSCSARVISSACFDDGSTVWLQAVDRIEGGREIDLLKRARAQHLLVDLAGQREHRGAIDLRVPEPGEQVRRPRTGDRQAGGGPAGELAVGGGRERGGALVADPDVVELPASSWRRIASASPRFEWPTIPKTWRTPQLTIVSTITSETVRLVLVRGLDGDVDPVRRGPRAESRSPCRRTRPEIPR